MEIINHTQLNECMTGDAELDQDLIQGAINEIAKRFHEMQEALTGQDYEAWRIGAHRSKGVAATLGFTALAEQFKKAEHEAHTDIERNNALITINEFIEQTRQVLLKNGVII